VKLLARAAKSRLAMSQLPLMNGARAKMGRAYPKLSTKESKITVTSY
jgi:hypothetical protein